MLELWEIDLSLKYRIMQILRQANYIRKDTNRVLVRYDKLTIPGSTPWSYGASTRKAFVPIEVTGEIDATSKVYVGGIEASPSIYHIDYSNGLVVFASNPGGVVTTDVGEWQVAMRDNYPTAEELTILDLPVVACKIRGVASRPMGIGMPTRMRTYRGVIDILASNTTQLNQITGTIEQYINYLPVVKFSEGQPLGYGGKLNIQYSFVDQFSNTARWLVQPTIAFIDKRRDGTDKEDYRSMIYLEFEFYS